MDGWPDESTIFGAVNVAAKSTVQDGLIMKASLPWERIATDLFQLKGHTDLLVVDYYFSRYIEISKLSGDVRISTHAARVSSTT